MYVRLESDGAQSVQCHTLPCSLFFYSGAAWGNSPSVQESERRRSSAVTIFRSAATCGRLREGRMIVLFSCHQSSQPAVTAFAGANTVAMYNVRSRCCFHARYIVDYILFQGLQVKTFCKLGIVHQGSSQHPHFRRRSLSPSPYSVLSRTTAAQEVPFLEARTNFEIIDRLSARDYLPYVFRPRGRTD